MRISRHPLGQAFLRQRYAAILDRKLHQTNERYRLIIDGSKDHALITTDASGRVTSWNPGAQRLFGYAETEILGADSSRFFTPKTLEPGSPSAELRNWPNRVAGWRMKAGWCVRMAPVS